MTMTIEKHEHQHHQPAPPKKGRMLTMAAPPKPEGPTFIDPVCGMTVTPPAAGSHEYKGTTYYFCNPSCLKRFRDNPEKYLAPDAAKEEMAPPPPVGTQYICPMDPEVRQDHPGACPKCGMALEPDLSTAQPFRVEYTCPMHPEIVRDAPGSCPICGMAL
jgi:Cu+-exporting ATPase